MSATYLIRCRIAVVEVDADRKLHRQRNEPLVDKVLVLRQHGLLGARERLDPFGSHPHYNAKADLLVL